MAELKPCDCGNTELDTFTQTDWDGDKEFGVICQRCKKVATGSTKEAAVDAWNRRS